MTSEHTQITIRECGKPSPHNTPRTTPHPITLLPAEILSEIMCYIPLFYDHDAPSIRPLDRDLDPSKAFTRDGPIRTPHWVAVSHVCHRWREIALRCKALWTCIPVVSVPWAQRALMLSNPHPLTLRIDSEDSSLDRGYASVEALCVVLSQISRIRKIRIRSPWGTRYGDQILSIVYGALCQGAPALEELYFASDTDAPFEAGSGPDRTTMLPVIAAMRVLHLDQCYLPQESFLFHSGLTHVRLSGSRVMWPTLESMLHTLALMPNVQVLELYGVLPRGSSPPDAHPVELPSLKELRLGGVGQSVLAVLRSLCLLENVQIFVTLPNTATEHGSRSRWLMKLRGKQCAASEHAHGVY